MKTLRGIIDSLEDSKIKVIRDSPLGGLLDFSNKPAWSATFGLFLLGRQLDIEKSNEISVACSVLTPRVSSRYWSCLWPVSCSAEKKKGTAGKEISFYSTLFGLESDVTVARVITMLKKKVPDDPSLRIRYAVLALVGGYLLPTSHYPKIVKEHAEIGESIYFSQFSLGSFNL